MRRPWDSGDASHAGRQGEARRRDGGARVAVSRGGLASGGLALGGLTLGGLALGGLTLGGLALGALPARAGDRSLTGSFAQTFLADSNLQQDNISGAGDGAALGSVSRLDLSYRDVSPTARLAVDGGLDWALYTGSENQNIAGLFPDLNGDYTILRPTQRLSFAANLNVEPVEYSNYNFAIFDPDEPDPDDPGTEDPDEAVSTRDRDAIRVNYGGSVSFLEEVNSRDSLNMSFSASRRDFLKQSPGLAPSTQLSLQTGWNRAINSHYGVGLAVTTSTIFSEEQQNRHAYTVALVPSLRYDRTPDQNFSFGLGPSFTITNLDEPTAFGTRRVSRENLGVRGNAGLHYVHDLVTTDISLSQSVVPSDEGEAVNLTAFSASVVQRMTPTARLRTSIATSYSSPLNKSGGTETDYLVFSGRIGFEQEINARSSYQIGFGGGYRDEDGDKEAAVMAGLAYQRSLTEDTALRLAYDFRHEEGTGESDSHRVTLVLTRAFTLLP